MNFINITNVLHCNENYFKNGNDAKEILSNASHSFPHKEGKRASFRNRIISEIIVDPVTPLGDIVVLGGGIAIESEASFI